MEIVTISSTLIKMFVCLFVYPVQKLQARKATLEGVSSTANAAKVEKWETVLVLSFMSSEESGEDESEQPVIYVKPLPWRHPQVNKFFMQMDDRIERKKSKHAKIQTLPCVQGQVSQRPDQQSFHITSVDLVQTNRKPGISLKLDQRP